MQEICHLSLNKLLNDIFQGFFAITPLSGSNHLPYRPFSTFQAYLQTLSAYLQDFEHIASFRICNFSSPDFTVPKITPDSQNLNEGYLRIFRDCGRVRTWTDIWNTSKIFFSDCMHIFVESIANVTSKLLDKDDTRSPSDEKY